MAIALCEKIYLWDGETQQVEQLKDVGYDGVVVTSLSWADKGRFLAIGLDNGRIQVTERERERREGKDITNYFNCSCMMLILRRRLEQ